MEIVESMDSLSLCEPIVLWNRYIESVESGLWWRHAALREVYGMGLPTGESGERPLPRLEGNTKPFRNRARRHQVPPAVANLKIGPTL
jgi:hypothetical protein